MKKLLQCVLLSILIFNCLAVYGTRKSSGEDVLSDGGAAEKLITLSFDEGIPSGSGYFDTWCSNGDLTVTLSNSYKNMNFSGNKILLYHGKSASYYKLIAPAGYKIAYYRILFSNNNHSCDMTVSSVGRNEQATSYGSEQARMEVSGINETETYISVIAAGGRNEAIVVDEFVVGIIPYGKYTPGKNQVLFSSYGSPYPYRIPALAVTCDSSIIAVSDYRPCRADIGAGDVDVHMRISRDNALSWGEERKIFDGTGSGNTAGYGDVAIVADRESDKVLMVFATGDVIFGKSGNFIYGGKKMRIAYSVSEDNGASWSAPKDITDEIYGKMDVLGAFFTSGRIMQSKIIKNGDYYRIYSVLCVNSNLIFNGDRCNNIVFYSDDFGETWNTLGGVAIYGGNEAKCEELPDGNLLVSSRRNGCRKFNIFKYTSPEKAEGAWQTTAESNNAGGIISGTADCNGEILIVDAVRNSDCSRTKVILQSVPVSSGREKLGIFYKELGAPSDYSTPQNIAKDWKGPYLVSNTFSAYSTMLVQPDNYIGFFFEETVVNEGYQMKYRKISLDEITDGEYTILKTVSVDDKEQGIIEEAEGAVWLELKADKDKSSSVLSEDYDVDVAGATVDYTFKLGECTFVSFPADIDLRKNSNLESLGFKYGGTSSENYTVMELKTDNSAVLQWKELQEPLLSKNKGYIIRINGGNETGNSVEVRFVLQGRGLSDSVNNNSYDFSDSVNYTETDSFLSGINVLGNPFLSTVNIAGSGAVCTENISGYFYKYDYIYDIFVPYDLNSVSFLEISPFSTFVVHACSENPGFVVNPSARRNRKLMSSEFYDTVKSLGLQLLSGNSRAFCDRTFFVMSDDGNDNFVVGSDAVKIWGGFNGKSSELASSLNGIDYAVNKISLNSCEIPLIVRVSAAGKYSIMPGNANGFDKYDSLLLYDGMNDCEYDLLSGGSGYEFSVDDVSEIRERFKLRITLGCGTGIEYVGENDMMFSVTGNNCNIFNLETGSEVIVYDLSGNIIDMGIAEFSDYTVCLDSGFYLIEVRSETGRKIRRIVIG